MTDQEHEPKKGFKVVDRRRFSDDGEERTGPDVAPDAPSRRPDPAAQAAAPGTASAGVAPAAPQTAAPAASAAAPGDVKTDPNAGSPAAPQKKHAEEVTPGGLSFSIFLQSLAQQALMQLGLIAWPHGQRELHLDQARDTIDIVTLLKLKTKGNLNPDEEQLIDAVVYELRMSYVEVQTAIARSKGAQAPRPPGR